MCHCVMLKHKIRKSRKNILSLLESVQEEEEKKNGKMPQYSEVKKRGKNKNALIGKYLKLFFHASNSFSQMKVTTLRKVLIANLRTGQGVYQEQKRRGNLFGM